MENARLQNISKDRNESVQYEQLGKGYIKEEENPTEKDNNPNQSLT